MAKKFTTIRMAYPFGTSIREFDPQLVRTTTDANLARNLYGQLVYLDNDGQITAGLASGIEWSNGECRLEIRTDTYTVDGIQIKPYDVYVSLLRIIIRDTNTHGSLRTFLCKSEMNISMQTGCSGLRYDNTSVYLKPSDERHRLFLIPLLASTDFSIIPAEALDLNHPKLPVKDYRNTTGPYYVEEDSASGEFVFKANTRNYLYSPDLSQIIKLVFIAGDDALKLFKEGGLDVITTVN